MMLMQCNHICYFSLVLIFFVIDSCSERGAFILILRRVTFLFSEQTEKPGNEVCVHLGFDSMFFVFFLMRPFLNEDI